MTSTYFEGEAEANPLAQRGYSRDHRPDCKQVCIALVVTFDGFPLGYEVFAGNTHDSKTVQTIVSTMEARHGVIGRVWIADRGMASADEPGVAAPDRAALHHRRAQGELRSFAAELAEPSGWREIRDGIEVKLARWPETGETAILCRSADRRHKEQAMHDRFSQRIEAALVKLAGRIERSRKRLDAARINRQIGRLLKRNQRAAARFQITVQAADCPAGLRLHVERSDAFDEWAAISEGAYVLRTNIADWSDEQLWRAYIQLTQAEAAFRIHKDQLRVRPIWHQRADRVQAHILVCFLAFVLWKCLEMWQQRAGLGNSPRTMLEELAASSRTTSSCPPQPTARSGCAASHSPTTPRPLCSIASASSCPSACAPTTSIYPSRSAPDTTPQNQKCSADFSANSLILLNACRFCASWARIAP